MKKILSYIFKLDILSMFIFIEPLSYPSQITYLNLIKNLIYYLIKLKFKFFFVVFCILIFVFIIDLFKILYSPLILLIYFSKYRFIQANYQQIGILNLHLSGMVKKNYNNGFKSIILIPKISPYAFVKKIFNNLIIIDGIFLNLILLPLKHSKLISCRTEEVDLFLNSKLKFIKKAPLSKIENNFKKKKSNLFKLNKIFIKEMKKYFIKKYDNIDMSKMYVIHIRTKNPKGTKSTNTRGTNPKLYFSSIKYLLSKGFYVIRLINDNDINFSFKNKKYIEINTDLEINKQLQYYLISRARGLICMQSGPGSIGSLLSRPVYETNLTGPYTQAYTEDGIFIYKKIALKNKVINFRKLIDLGFYEGQYACKRYCDKKGFKFINNTSSEILDSLKEFIYIKKLNSKQKEKQLKFKNSLPDYFDRYSSNISNRFIIKNKKIFKEMNL